MTDLSVAPVITISIDGKAYNGSYVVDGDMLVVYADGYGQETTGRSASPDETIAKMVLRSIIMKGRKS